MLTAHAVHLSSHFVVFPILRINIIFLLKTQLDRFYIPQLYSKLTRTNHSKFRKKVEIHESKSEFYQTKYEPKQNTTLKI